MDALLSVRGLVKQFPGQRALDDVNLDVHPGEIVALAGANGSGKSTLIKTLAGYHEPDAGEITAFGQPLLPGPKGAELRSRIRCIHQDLGLIPILSAAENLALGSRYETTRAKRISWPRQRKRARKALGRFGASFDVDIPVQQLSAAEQTTVAIARALDGWEDTAALLVLDEPTASLSGVDVEKLFTATRAVAASGAGVIFVSHRIQEMLDLCDRAVVLRDGRVAATRDVATLTADHLVELIAGRAVEDLYTEAPSRREAVVLSVRGLSGGQLRDVSFDLHRGEILGVTGLAGSGHDTLLHLLYGGRTPESGEIAVSGKLLPRGSIKGSVGAGVGLVPADRVGHGVVPTLNVGENITLPRLGPLWNRWRLDRGRERAEIATWMQNLRVVPNDRLRPILQLSGGNQQKALLAKWFRISPQIMLLDEPTHGVDVGSKAAIYRYLAAAAADGMALVIATGEARDLAEVCERVLVFRDGAIAAELQGRSLTEQRIVRESIHETQPTGGKT